MYVLLPSKMSVVRATSSGHRSPKTIQTMTVDQQGQNILVDAADDHTREDMEVSNINSTNFYSPQSQTPQSGSRSPSSLNNPSQQQPNIRISDPNDQKEADLRRRCAFFFMNPIDKFIAR